MDFPRYLLYLSSIVVSGIPGVPEGVDNTNMSNLVNDFFFWFYDKVQCWPSDFLMPLLRRSQKSSQHPQTLFAHHSTTSDTWILGQISVEAIALESESAEALMCFGDLVHAKNIQAMFKDTHTSSYPLTRPEADYPIIRQFLADPVRAGSFLDEIKTMVHHKSVSSYSQSDDNPLTQCDRCQGVSTMKARTLCSW